MHACALCLYLQGPDKGTILMELGLRMVPLSFARATSTPHWWTISQRLGTDI